MARIILVYGAISGAITVGSIILGLVLAGDGEGAHTAPWLGYLVMIVALSVIFVGIKQYRDRHLGGVISFGAGFLLGLGITVAASVVYVATWEAYLSLTDYSFIGDYAESVLAGKRAEGLSGEALQAEAAKLEQLERQYADPIFRVPMTFLEIFPVGLLITLIAAALLRNARFMPARGAQQGVA